MRSRQPLSRSYVNQLFRHRKSSMFDKLLNNFGRRSCKICDRYLTLSSFVPKSEPCLETELKDLISLLSDSRKVLVLTGAGVSTESGIPDYRSEGVGLYARSSNRPVQIQQFMSSEATRRRYWARNYVGWPRFSSVLPNATHRVLSRWENSSDCNLPVIGCLVTQNVDQLHSKAGSRTVVELHGTAFRVNCMNCDASVDRHQLQSDMRSENSHLLKAMPPTQMIRPDGDVDIPHEFINSFQTPCCVKCGGILKPDIVFFGDNVPRARVDHVLQQLAGSDTLLVVGSSLQVYSGYRFVLEAKEKKKKIIVINIGPTRADHLVDLKLSRKCGDVFERLNSSYLIQ